MRNTVDAFIRTVEDARHRLSKKEGRNVSVRELVRRAGFDESQRAGVTYHLNPNRHDGTKPHNVPPDLVKRLAAVLPTVTEEELTKSAQVAAGFTEVDTSSEEVAYVVQRFYGDDSISAEEKAGITARILRIIADVTGE